MLFRSRTRGGRRAADGRDVGCRMGGEEGDEGRMASVFSVEPQALDPTWMMPLRPARNGRGRRYRRRGSGRRKLRFSTPQGQSHRLPRTGRHGAAIPAAWSAGRSLGEGCRQIASHHPPSRSRIKEGSIATRRAMRKQARRAPPGCGADELRKLKLETYYPALSNTRVPSSPLPLAAAARRCRSPWLPSTRLCPGQAAARPA